MVAVTKRFERGPVKSRVSAFPDVFSVTIFRLKRAETRSEPRVRFRLATGECANNRWVISLYLGYADDFYIVKCCVIVTITYI